MGDWEGLVGEPPALEEEAAAQLRVPAYLPKHARFIKGNSVHVFFDGGSLKGVDAVGYIIINNF